MRCRRIDDGKFEVDGDKGNSKDKNEIQGSFPFGFAQGQDDGDYYYCRIDEVALEIWV